MLRKAKVVKAILLIIGILAGLPTLSVLAETKTVMPRGEYARIDTRPANETMQVLTKGTIEEKQKIIEKIKAYPENYAPPVFYLLSNVLFSDGKKDEGAFWFYAGQLRARIDANLCADSTARQAVGVLNQNYGNSINEYTLQDIPKFEELIQKIMAWERKTPYNYDRRWINLHGMGAMLSGLGAKSPESSSTPLNLPKGQWNNITEKTRTDYLSDFHEAMNALKNKNEKKPASSARQPFDIHDGHVRYTNLVGGRYRVDSADPATFEHVGGTYGRDKTHVFYAHELVEGADPASFVAIGDEAGHDANAVYFKNRRCPNCDVASFRRLEVDWYADKNTAYYKFLTPVPDVDTASFKRLNNWFAKDAHNVFSSGVKIPGADAASFKLASNGKCEVCGEDKYRCYWFEHPVPCDWKPHSRAEFPGPMIKIPQGKALLIMTGPIDIDRAEVNTALHGMSVGYWRVDAGRQTLSLNCWNKDHIERSKFTIDVEPARLYSFKRRQGTACEVDVEHPAMILGRIDGPEIQIQVEGDKKAKWQAELPPGMQKLTAICRDVTRTGVTERSVDLNLQLKAGEIYELRADFKAPEYKCDIRATLLAPK